MEGLLSYQAEVAEGLAMNFEYLDHTADVQLHAWGATLEEAFQNCALAMFNYEEKQKRESQILADFRTLVNSKLGQYS